MTTWTNADGLLVRFSTSRSAPATDGVESAREQILEFALEDATTLADAASTAAVAGDRPFIPSGALIREAVFVVDTAFTSGGSAVLDIGLKVAAGTVTDDDGIDAAVAVAALVANAGIESDGALVGTKVTADSYPVFSYDTAAFTAGAGRLRIKYEV